MSKNTPLSEEDFPLIETYYRKCAPRSLGKKWANTCHALAKDLDIKIDRDELRRLMNQWWKAQGLSDPCPDNSKKKRKKRKKLRQSNSSSSSSSSSKSSTSSEEGSSESEEEVINLITSSQSQAKTDGK